MSIFFLCYFKALFLQEESLNLTRQRQEQGCLCSFSRALGAISIHQAHPHPFLGPGPQSLVEDRWKITDMWTKDRNGPDLEPRGEVPSCPPAGPAYPHPLPTLLPPPQPAPGCHLQPLIHQSFRKWLLPSCLPQGYPTPPHPKAHLETRTQRWKRRLFWEGGPRRSEPELGQSSWRREGICPWTYRLLSGLIRRRRSLPCPVGPSPSHLAESPSSALPTNLSDLK